MALWGVLSSQNGSGDHQTIANAASWTVWGSKMDSKGSPGAPTQRLGAVWSAKWGPNELSERRKIVKKVCVFTCKLAFSLLQGFNLSTWLLRSLGNRQRSPKWAPKELPERRKIVKKVCVFIYKLAFTHVETSQHGSGDH